MKMNNSPEKLSFGAKVAYVLGSLCNAIGPGMITIIGVQHGFYIYLPLVVR